MSKGNTTLDITLQEGFLMLYLLLLALILSPSMAFAQAVLENPALGSNQSGIGIVSGWKCAASVITVTFDDGAPFQAAYGTAREDTRPTCGDANNGFGFLFNWSILGDGQHTVKVFDGGVQFGSAIVTVATFGAEFFAGQSGTLTGSFAGRQVTAQWSEAAQNFIITSTGNPPSTGETGKWQASRTSSSFSDLPTVTLSLAAETPVADSLGNLQIPVFIVRCQLRSNINPAGGNFIVIGMDHNQPVTETTTFARFDGDDVHLFVLQETADNGVIMFLNNQSVEFVDALLPSQMMAYQFTVLERGDVETTFDLRGLRAAIDQQMTISLNNDEGNIFDTYNCVPK